MKFVRSIGGIILMSFIALRSHSCMCATSGRLDVVNHRIAPGETLIVHNSLVSPEQIAKWKFWLVGENKKSNPLRAAFLGASKDHLLLYPDVLLEPGDYRLNFEADPKTKKDRANALEWLEETQEHWPVSVALNQAGILNQLPELTFRGIRTSSSDCGIDWQVDLTAAPTPGLHVDRMKLPGPFLLVLERPMESMPAEYQFVDDLHYGENSDSSINADAFSLNVSDPCDWQFHMEEGVSILRIYRKDGDRLTPVRSWRVEMPIPGGMSFAEYRQVREYFSLKGEAEYEHNQTPGVDAEQRKLTLFVTTHPGIEKKVRAVEKYFKNFERAEISFSSRELHVVPLQDPESLKTKTLDDFVVPVKKAAAENH